MKKPSARLLHAGVITLTIVAAASVSSQAYAWGHRTTPAVEKPVEGKAKGRFHRDTAAAGQTGATARANAWGNGAAHANAAAANGQAHAEAGGWRARFAHPNAQASSNAGASGTRTGTYSTLHHGGGTFTQDYTRGQGTSTRDNTVTGDNGKTASWTTQQSVTHGDGTLTGATTVTGENGKTWNGSTTVNANNDTLTHTVTGVNGQTRGVTLQGDGTPGDGDRSGTYTTQSGKTGTYDQKVSYSDGTITRDNTVTNANGQSAGWTANVTGSSANGVTTKDKTITTDSGKVESWDTSYDKNTDTLTHTYTAPNGRQYGGTAVLNQ